MTYQYTPGSWFVGKMRLDDNGISQSLTVGPFEAADHYEDTICEVWDGNHNAEANARLIAAAPELLEAAALLEAAETAHANCRDCEGLGVPELCGMCFPLFDEARVKRRAAIAKAEGQRP